MSKNKLFPIILLFTILGISLISMSNIESSTNNPSIGTTASGSYTMFLYVSGELQGDIQGSVTVAGHEDTIGVLAYSHSIEIPIDEASGLPSGRRQHSPFIITKVIDKATPLLYSALAMGENLPTFELRFYGVDDLGHSVNFFTIELMNAHIIQISTQGSDLGGTERISFVYQKIVWTWEEGGITSEDDWQAPTS
jgi:type VI secretion system secreted protein Hcp